HLVMLGTPNMGSPCADLADGLLDPLGKRVEALRQLEPGEVAKFNSQTTNRKGVKFSILVGVFTTRTCGTGVPGDIVVPVPSAEWEIGELGYVNRIHTGLTGQQDFEFWVKPHLALGPKKAAVGASVAENNRPGFVSAPIRENLMASADLLSILSLTNSQNEAPKVVQSRNLPLKAGESAEMPVSAAANAANGITFLASSNVTVSLVDGEGETVERVEAGSPESAEIFKSFDLSGRTGNFTLRFENTGERDESAFAAVWTSTNALNLEFVELEKRSDGTVKLQAKLTNNGAPVKAASVTVKVDQQNTEAVLFDDGKHGDGEANDGVYGGVTEKLADGDHLVQGKAAVNGMTASAATVLSVGARSN
ncbi:MAG TPA: choice-of-anchor X domain-containing protein, partial [Pyrinomonadaceae bacterium]|nr:choice-of-anchor X domain-containing protein [Pyrinomonadaceae bacterium]